MGFYYYLLSFELNSVLWALCTEEKGKKWQESGGGVRRERLEEQGKAAERCDSNHEAKLAGNPSPTHTHTLTYCPTQ